MYNVTFYPQQLCSIVDYITANSWGFICFSSSVDEATLAEGKVSKKLSNSIKMKCYVLVGEVNVDKSLIYLFTNRVRVFFFNCATAAVALTIVQKR